MSTTDFPLPDLILQKYASTQAQDSHNDEVKWQECTITKLEFLDITEKQRYADRPRTFLTASFFSEEPREIASKYGEYALLLGRRLDKDSNILGTTLEINSSIIGAALREVLAQSSDLNLTACPIQIPWPYTELVHRREKIFAWAEFPDRTGEEREHISVLTSFIRHHPVEFEP